MKLGTFLKILLLGWINVLHEGRPQAGAAVRGSRCQSGVSKSFPGKAGCSELTLSRVALGKLSEQVSLLGDTRNLT